MIPPENPQIYDILKRETRLHAHLVVNLAEKLELGEDFPTETPRKLCNLIKNTAWIIKEHLESTPVEQLRHVDYLLNSIAEDLRFVERSRITQTPWSIVQTAELFFKKYAGEECDFIIRPQWSYNYGIRGDFIEVYNKRIKLFTWIPEDEWKELTKDHINKKIYCISFPKIERLNAPLHACWGHEVGHIIASRWLQEFFENLWETEQEEIKKKIKKKVEYDAPPLTDSLFKTFILEQAVAEQLNQTRQLIQSGLTELICDYVGIFLLGPASLAAESFFSIRFSLDESPLDCGYYPPWRYRLRGMLNELKEDCENLEALVEAPPDELTVEFLRPLLEWLKIIREQVQIQEDKILIEQNLLTREAYRVIEMYWPNIKKEISGLLPKDEALPFKLYKHLKKVILLAQRLENDIPPNETGVWPNASASSFETILNAGWMFKIKKIVENEDWGTFEDCAKFFRLMLKGVEANYVQSEFGVKLNNQE